MRQGQQHRRGRGSRHNNSNTSSSGNTGNQHRKGQNPLTRSFESNGPDVKIRGTPAHVAEKYFALARDALLSGDRVLAENYLQHAEHYNRIILTYREQHLGQQNDGSSRFRVAGLSDLDGDENGDDDGDDNDQSAQQPPRGMEPQPGSGGQRTDDRGDRQERHVRHDRGERQDRQPRQDRPHRNDNRDNRFEARGDGRQDNRSDNRQDGRPDYRQDSRPDRQDNRQYEPRSDMRPENRSENRGEGRVDNRGEGRQQARTEGGYDNNRQERGRYREQQPRGEAPPRAEAGRVEPAQPGPVEQPVAIPAPAPASTPARAESAPRRRERFVEPQDDQPAFLRRPVRRTRREATEETVAAGDAATDGGDGKTAV